jgi:hypothetical protein
MDPNLLAAVRAAAIRERVIDFLDTPTTTYCTHSGVHTKQQHCAMNVDRMIIHEYGRIQSMSPTAFLRFRSEINNFYRCCNLYAKRSALEITDDIDTAARQLIQSWADVFGATADKLRRSDVDDACAIDIVAVYVSSSEREAFSHFPKDTPQTLRRRPPLVVPISP